MLTPLRDLADVRAGHPFRGRVPVAHDGNARVIQMRDVASDGSVDWQTLVRCRVATRRGTRAPDWLQAGDVLFAARGRRNYAVCLGEVPSGTVCAQYFFVLRLKSVRVLPAYLAWHINRAPSQHYLRLNAEGSDQPSIRRGVLESLPLAVPDIEHQRALVALADAAGRQRHVFDALTHNRECELDALAWRLLQPATPTQTP